MVVLISSALKIPQRRSTLHYSFPKPKFHQSSGYPYPGWNYVELKFSPNYSAIQNECPWIPSSHGLIYCRFGLVVWQSKVSPIKRLSIPRLELCGAQVLTKLLCHSKRIFNVPVDSVFAWTDILSFWAGCLAVHGGSRASSPTGSLASSINFLLNDGDMSPASTILLTVIQQVCFQLNYKLWWEGPYWLKLEPSMWLSVSSETIPEEERSVCLVVTTATIQPIIPVKRSPS